MDHFDEIVLQWRKYVEENDTSSRWDKKQHLVGINDHVEHALQSLERCCSGLHVGHASASSATTDSNSAMAASSATDEGRDKVVLARTLEYEI